MTADLVVRVGIAGIAGRMGRMLAEEVTAADVVLAGGIDREGAVGPGEAALLSDIAELAAAADVVVDFTHASAVRRHAEALSAAGTAWVIGTTGLSAEDDAAVTWAAAHIAVVQAPNFSAGVTLLIALAEQMGAAFPAEGYDAEIIEMHHRQKVDAPSGTAIGLGEAVARGRGVALASVKESGRDGHTGPRRPGAIGFAALRAGQVVGEHTLLFASATEHISLTHRAFDRRVFAAGAVRAAVWAARRSPGRYSMFDVLNLPRGSANQPA